MTTKNSAAHPTATKIPMQINNNIIRPIKLKRSINFTHYVVLLTFTMQNYRAFLTGCVKTRKSAKNFALFLVGY